MKRFRSVFAVFTILLLLAVVAVAQLETATVTGVVKDSTGAVISGAQVTVTSEGTNASRSATSDNSGLYTISNLPPGPYAVKVSQKGFGDFKQKIVLGPAQRSGIDATLSAAG